MMNTHEGTWSAFDENWVPEQMISLAEAGTLDGLFRARVRRTPDAEAYRFFSRRSNNWQTMNWRQVAEQVARWQKALNDAQLEPGDRVAVMMENCVYWVILDQAALALGLVLVPLYANDRADNLAYILQDSGASLLLIKEQEQVAQLEQIAGELAGITLRSILPVSSTLLTIECIDDWLPESGENIIASNSPGTLASIVYTSGTTGHPKGVMLSHGNMLWNAWAGLRSMMIFPDDQHLSFLPLSHTLERTVGYYLMMMAGARVAYTRSIPELAEDLLLIRPTVMIAVPRIFERVYGKLMATLEQGSALKKAMFQLAVRVGWQHFLIAQGRMKWSPGQLLYPLLDRLVGGKVRARLGGRLRIAIVGGAAIPPEISKLFLSLGVPILQGYGLTETSPVISVNSFHHNQPESVGQLLRDVEIKLDHPSGELLIKSPGVMQGYWKRKQASADAFDAEGWLKTGDIARYENGFLYITGRIKEILVLANGEKVPPIDIESALASDPLIEQVLLVGEGRPYLAALLVLNEEEVNAWFARKANRRMGSRDEVIREELKHRIRNRLRDFPGYAHLYQFAIIEEPWTIENELLTPTLKLKRNRVQDRYAKEIELLYQGH